MVPSTQLQKLNALKSFRNTYCQVKPQEKATNHTVEFKTISAGCNVTLIAQWLSNASNRGEPVAWIQTLNRIGYPPDIIQNRIKKDSLVFINLKKSRNLSDFAKAAEIIVRSNGFGAVLIDLQNSHSKAFHPNWQARLVQQARQQQVDLLWLTNAENDLSENRSHPSKAQGLGPLIGIRADTQRIEHAKSFELKPIILKQKTVALPELLNPKQTMRRYGLAGYTARTRKEK